MVLVGLAAAQETGAPAKGVFGGTVTDAVTGQGLARAQVRLIAAGLGQQYQTTTDGDGGFRFNALAGGIYEIQASRSGYADAHSFAPKDGTAAASGFQLAGGQSITNARIALEPEGTIAGRVMDEDGNPVPDASVAAIAERWQRGQRSYDLLSAHSTDADGTYQFRLAAGRYYVQASVRSNGAVPQTFVTEPGGLELKIGAVIYPNATDIQGSTALEVAPGQQVTGIDFKLRAAPCYHVRGTVTGAARSVVFLRQRGAGMTMIYTGGATNIRPDGSFDIAGVLPGRYTLQSFPGTQIVVPVNVDVTDRDVTGVTMESFNHFDVSGHVEFDGSGERPAIEVDLSTVDAAQSDFGSTAYAKPDGSFTITGLPATRFAVLLRGDQGLYVESATVGGRMPPDGLVDLTHGAVGPIEIVVAKGTGRVDGKVRLPDAAPGKVAVPEIRVVLVRADGITGNTGARSTGVDANGRFEFAPVPPGRWYVLASPQFESGLWQNMDFVRAIAAEGAAVDVADSGSVQVEVTLMPMASIRQARDGVGR